MATAGDGRCVGVWGSRLLSRNAMHFLVAVFKREGHLGKKEGNCFIFAWTTDFFQLNRSNFHFMQLSRLKAFSPAAGGLRAGFPFAIFLSMFVCLLTGLCQGPQPIHEIAGYKVLLQSLLPWVLAQLGICSPGLTHHCDLEWPLLRDDCVCPCLARLAMTLFLASVSHQWSLATSKSHVERNPPHG